MDKKLARKAGLKQRSALSFSEKKYAESIVFEKLKILVNQYQRIGIYISFGNEMNTYDVIAYCWKNGIEVCVPKVVDNTLEFFLIESWDDVRPSSFGILEPFNENRIRVEEIPLQIIPLSSFDSEKHRTGYGKGYYDSVLKGDVCKAGIAFACQEVSEIEVDPWDVTLNHILTEKNDI